MQRAFEKEYCVHCALIPRDKHKDLDFNYFNYLSHFLPSSILAST